MTTAEWITVAVAVGWLAISVAVGLIVGPVLRRCSVSLEEIDADFTEGVAQPVESR